MNACMNGVLGCNSGGREKENAIQLDAPQVDDIVSVLCEVPGSSRTSSDTNPCHQCQKTWSSLCLQCSRPHCIGSCCLSSTGICDPTGALKKRGQLPWLRHQSALHSICFACCRIRPSGVDVECLCVQSATIMTERRIPASASCFGSSTPSASRCRRTTSGRCECTNWRLPSRCVGDDACDPARPTPWPDGRKAFSSRWPWTMMAMPRS